MSKINTETKNKAFLLRADETNSNQRIDNFLIKILKGVPKTHVYRLIRKGEVRINKKRVKPDYHICLNDQIRVPPVRLTAKIPPNPATRVIKLLENRILYEDENLLIINKPSGIASHGGSGINFGVIETIRHMRPKAKFLALAHRLDRDTSGCIIIAKKRRALLEIQDLLHKHQIIKTYLALVCGKWEEKIKMVEAPLLKNQLKSGERMVFVDNEGKEAKTEFKLRRQFADAALIEARIHTGRTHQIRVHAAHIGHPIVGDDKYGNKEFNKKVRAMGFKRLFLHAYILHFTLPSTKTTINVKASLDHDLLNNTIFARHC